MCRLCGDRSGLPVPAERPQQRGFRVGAEQEGEGHVDGVNQEPLGVVRAKGGDCRCPASPMGSDSIDTGQQINRV